MVDHDCPRFSLPLTVWHLLNCETAKKKSENLHSSKLWKCSWEVSADSSYFEKQNPVQPSTLWMKEASGVEGDLSTKTALNFTSTCNSPQHRPTHSINLASVGNAQMHTCQTGQAGASLAVKIEMHSGRLHAS